jgi:hypothetical protein
LIIPEIPKPDRTVKPKDLTFKKTARNSGCCCSGCQRKSDLVFDMFIDKISSLKWSDDDSYHARSHHQGYLKAIKDMKRLFDIDTWMDECNCHMCIIKNHDF